MRISWKPIDDIILENSALDSIFTTNNALVYAGPGSGKTELLAQKACFIFQTNQLKNNRKILAISFKKDAASNLQDRVIKRCPSVSTLEFESMTYDAFAKQILDHFLLALPSEFQPTNDYIIEKTIKPIVIPIYEKITEKELTKDECDYVVRKIERTQLDAIGKIGLETWKKLLALEPSHMSFPLITLIATYLLSNNPMLIKAIQFTYKHVFLDEFQDTTTIQFELIKTIFQGSDSLITAVGDEKQRIMVWAGADNDVFNKYKRFFSAETFTLLINHRSAPALLSIQKKMYATLNDSQIDTRYSDKWDSEDGQISLLEFSDENQETEIIISIIKERIRLGLEPREICILTKQLPINYAYSVIQGLAKENINVRIETDYQDLLKENIIMLVIAAIRTIYGINDVSSWDYISYYFDSSVIGEFNIKKMNELDSILKKIREKNPIITTKTQLENLVNDIVDLLVISNIKNVFREYQQGTYLQEVISKFIELFSLDLSDQISFSASLDKFLGFDSIPVMTIHKSKGLEYKMIVFIGLEDSAFWNFKKQPDEDKCAFFVALSRAKETVIFTYSKYRINSKYPKMLQTHSNINELFELLASSKEVNHLKY
jgi:superfamily I DNA/RNA helicase